eukprot:gene10132-7224_t
MSSLKMNRVFISKEISASSGHIFQAAVEAVTHDDPLDGGWGDKAFLTTVQEVHRTKGAGFDVSRCVGLPSIDSESLLEIMPAEEVASLHRESPLLEFEVGELQTNRRLDSIKMTDEKKKVMKLEKEVSARVEDEKSKCDKNFCEVMETFEQRFQSFNQSLAEATDSFKRQQAEASDSFKRQLAEVIDPLKRQLTEVTDKNDYLEHRLNELKVTVEAVVASTFVAFK